MSMKSKNHKYNYSDLGVINTEPFTGNTITQKAVNNKKRKATFDMDPDLHRQLRIYAAHHDITMVTVLERILRNYFNQK